jgi:hypothetical protein
MKQGDLWVFFFALGILVFNWPFLTVFEGSLVSGLFFLWGAFIVVAALAGRGEKRDRNR